MPCREYLELRIRILEALALLDLALRELREGRTPRALRKAIEVLEEALDNVEVRRSG